MNRTAFLGLALACLALSAASCGKGKSYFPQSKTLDAHTSVILKDAWVVGSSNQFLRALFIFEGSDPNQMYDLKAALRSDEKGEDIKSIYVWYVPYSVEPTNRVKMFWEFKDFPTNTPNIYLREYYMDKATGRMAKSLDFILPGKRQLRLDLLNNQPIR